MKDYIKLSYCRLCLSKKLKQIFDFGKTPIGNDLIKKIQIKKKIKKYPLKVNQCMNCGHHQLSISIDNKILYSKNYTYLSGVSKEFIEHFQNYVSRIGKIFKLKKNDLVIDIGSNDGTLLDQFKNQLQCKVLGIDPAQVPAKIANLKKIRTLNCFFNFKTSQFIKKNYDTPRLITSHNVFAHVRDLYEYFKSIDNICGEHTIIIIEIGYWLEVIKNSWFDTIYHEHHDYHSLKPLVSFFHRFLFNVIDCKITKPQGGSLMIFLKKSLQKKIYKKIKRQISLEENFRLYKLTMYKNKMNNLLKLKKEINFHLNNIVKSKKIIAAFGSPTKAVTLLSFFAIKKNVISKIYEDNALKCNLFNPYNKIPIVKSSKIIADKPDYIIILAWNFAKSVIINNEYFTKSGGIFILPLPFLKFIKNKNEI